MTDIIESSVDNDASTETHIIEMDKIPHLNRDYIFNRSNSWSSTDDGSELYSEAVEMADSIKSKAERLKFMNNFMKFLFIVLGSASAVLGIKGGNDTAVATIGFTVAGLQSLLSVFPVGDRSVLLNHMSIKLRKTSREIKKVMRMDIPANEKYKLLDKCSADLDELDEAIFNDDVVSSKGKPTLHRQISPASR